MSDRFEKHKSSAIFFGLLTLLLLSVVVVGHGQRIASPWELMQWFLSGWLPGF